jgi:hypothetical protein
VPIITLKTHLGWNHRLFEVFRNNVESHYGQIGAGYLFDSSFQEAYLERGVDCYLERTVDCYLERGVRCYVDFLDEVPYVS